MHVFPKFYKNHHSRNILLVINRPPPSGFYPKANFCFIFATYFSIKKKTSIGIGTKKVAIKMNLQLTNSGKATWIRMILSKFVHINNFRIFFEMRIFISTKNFGEYWVWVRTLHPNLCLQIVGFEHNHNIKF